MGTAQGCCGGGCGGATPAPRDPIGSDASWNDSAADPLGSRATPPGVPGNGALLGPSSAFIAAANLRAVNGGQAVAARPVGRDSLGGNSGLVSVLRARLCCKLQRCSKCGCDFYCAHPAGSQSNDTIFTHLCQSTKARIQGSRSRADGKVWVPFQYDQYLLPPAISAACAFCALCAPSFLMPSAAATSTLLSTGEAW